MSGSGIGSSRLPGGAAMAPGEVEVVAGRFMYSTVAFYLSTDLMLTNRRFVAVRPNTLLGLIPVGTRRSNYPIENIAGVNAGTRFSVGGAVLGTLAILIGVGALGLPGAGFLGVLLLILGLPMVIGSPQQAIEVMNSGGGVITFPVSVFERRRTLEFAGQVSEAMARSTRGRPAAPPASAPAERADSRRALRDIEQLRADRLITEEEFAEKRAEILKRL